MPRLLARLLDLLDRLPDPWARALRTLIQGLVAAVIVSVVDAITEAGTVAIGWTQFVDAVDAGLVAGLAAVTAIVSLLQNKAEERHLVRPVGKRRPPE